MCCSECNQRKADTELLEACWGVLRRALPYFRSFPLEHTITVEDGLEAILARLNERLNSTGKEE